MLFGACCWLRLHVVTLLFVGICLVSWRIVFDLLDYNVAFVVWVICLRFGLFC